MHNLTPHSGDCTLQRSVADLQADTSLKTASFGDLDGGAMAEHFIQDDRAERGVREAVQYGDGRANPDPNPNPNSNPQVYERTTMSTETGGLTLTRTLTLTLTLTLTRYPRGRL